VNWAGLIKSAARLRDNAGRDLSGLLYEEDPPLIREFVSACQFVFQFGGFTANWCDARFTLAPQMKSCMKTEASDNIDRRCIDACKLTPAR
jgi:hypothetical protein